MVLYQKSYYLTAEGWTAQLAAGNVPPVGIELKSTVLNLGSGGKPRLGALNVDVTARTSPDLVHDLNVTPWPLPANHFSEVHAYDVLEHLDNVVLAMEEIHRVCAQGARVFITVPHFSAANSFVDPTHRHCFSARSMLYFTEGHELRFYSDARFRQNHAFFVFHQSPLNRVVRRLANRFTLAYEERWAWIFPAWFIHFELETIKNA